MIDKEFTVYLHSSKEYMNGIGEELELTGDALYEFMFTCYEVKLTMNLNTDTGETTITKVNDIKLETTNES